MPTFLRRTSNRYSKLGKGRKKKQIWRRPTGRDNKMREKRKGYPAVVSLGYRGEKSLRDNLKEKAPVKVFNVEDLKKVGKDQIAVISGVGKKKKLEIAMEAKEQKIEIYNMNAKNFLKDNKKKEKKK
jgi:large subunit ribosomal protein L32e